MRTTIAAVLVGLVAVIAAWSAYAYAQGGGPLRPTVAAVCQPACEPATQPCDKTPICHDETDCSPADCPKFHDTDGDGRCDVAGDCGLRGSSGCGTYHRGCRQARGHGCGGHPSR